MSTNSLWKRIKSRALSVSTDEVRLVRRRIEPKNPAELSAEIIRDTETFTELLKLLEQKS